MFTDSIYSLCDFDSLDDSELLFQEESSPCDNGVTPRGCAFVSRRKLGSHVASERLLLGLSAKTPNYTVCLALWAIQPYYAFVSAPCTCRLDPLLVHKPLSAAKQTCIAFAYDTKVPN